MKKRYNNLSIYRILATLGIIIFHFFYYTTNPRDQICQMLALQVAGITALSGFLLSKKEIDNTKKFYKDYFLKLLIPILIGIVVVTLLDFIVALFNAPETFLGLFFSKQPYADGVIIQFGNLWYIPFISACYLITPLLKKDNKIYAIITIAAFLVAEYAVYYFGNVRIQILPFLIGYFIGSLSFEKYVSTGSHQIPRAFVWATLLAFSTFIRFHQFEGALSNIMEFFHPFNDALIGISSFFLFISLFSYANLINNVKFFGFTDKIACCIFIVTLVFYGGATSIITSKINYNLQLPLILVFTISLAILVYWIQILLTKAIKKANKTS